MRRPPWMVQEASCPPWMVQEASRPPKRPFHTEPARNAAAVQEPTYRPPPPHLVWGELGEKRQKGSSQWKRLASVFLQPFVASARKGSASTEESNDPRPREHSSPQTDCKSPRGAEEVPRRLRQVEGAEGEASVLEEERAPPSSLAPHCCLSITLLRKHVLRPFAPRIWLILVITVLHRVYATFGMNL